MLLGHYMGVAKMLVLFLQHHRLMKIKTDLQNETFRYSNFGSFQPEKMMIEAKRFCSKVSVIIFASYFTIAVLCFVSTVIRLEVENDGETLKDKTCYDYLPYIYYIPFDETTKTKCIYASLLMSYNIVIFSGVIACHDALYFAFVYCLKTQFLILGGAIRTIRGRVLQRLNLPSNYAVFNDDHHPALEKEMYNELIFVNKHFKLLISVTNEIEKAFTYQTLAQTIVTLIMIASSLFIMSNIPLNSIEFFTQAEYCLCVFGSANILYWSGTGIIVASDDISQALYETDWFSSSRRFKKAVLIIMSRNKTPLWLTIGRFVPLNLSVSATVCKASYSYYAVFKRVEANA
ncbi:unnamed protein product [Acanthoscelides obtectus]|uniref:Odorant receptor n=1 Tax=Acanthoscelides obtectus TaxID=200917 RepID=A0A9P0LIE2_ACAOB|nr:unnamed protein product [Acanthoscelides obtectus]CAK1663293.1 Odorant receptor Or2 [Acanthoscelides obtectus]